MRLLGCFFIILGSEAHKLKIMKRIKVSYIRVSSLDQNTDRQRVNDKDFDSLLEIENKSIK